MLKSMGFIEGMYYGSSKCKSSSTFKAFDWLKAAELIRKHKPKVAEAGLQGDWNCTVTTIYCDEQPCLKNEHDSHYLLSLWTTPLLVIDGVEIECFKEYAEDDFAMGDPNDLWPAEAIAILKGI